MKFGIFLCTVLALLSQGSEAADFSVSPMSIELEGGARSGQIQVRNLDQQAIRFQVNGSDWSQDENGNNVYAESKTLIWFPRALELAPGESRIIRVGVRATPALQEQAYIIALQEVPVGQVQAQNPRGAQVRLLLSVSVPVFVPPARPLPGGTVESVDLRDGKLEFVVANKGNLHFSFTDAKIVGLNADGTEKFTETVRGRTLLAAARQRVQVQIPTEKCLAVKNIAIILSMPDQSEIKHRMDVSRANCE